MKINASGINKILLLGYNQKTKLRSIGLHIKKIVRQQKLPNIYSEPYNVLQLQ